MMWNKGNGGSANQDDGRWLLRGKWNQQLTVQCTGRPGVCCRLGAANNDGRRGSECAKIRLNRKPKPGREAGVGGRIDGADALNPGDGEGERVQIKGWVGLSGRLRRRGEEARGLKREAQAGGEAELSEALRSNK